MVPCSTQTTMAIDCLPGIFLLFTLTSPRSSPFAVNYSLHCGILFCKNVLKFSAISNISMHSFTQLCGTRSYDFSVIYPCHGQIGVAFFCNPLKLSYQSIVDTLFHDSLFCIFFVLLEEFFLIQDNCTFPQRSLLLKIFHINGRHVNESIIISCISFQQVLLTEHCTAMCHPFRQILFSHQYSIHL